MSARARLLRVLIAVLFLGSAVILATPTYAFAQAPAQPADGWDFGDE